MAPVPPEVATLQPAHALGSTTPACTCTVAQRTSFPSPLPSPSVPPTCRTLLGRFEFIDLLSPPPLQVLRYWSDEVTMEVQQLVDSSPALGVAWELPVG